MCLLGQAKDGDQKTDYGGQMMDDRLRNSEWGRGNLLNSEVGMRNSECNLRRKA
jgi:hypothetical protein